MCQQDARDHLGTTVTIYLRTVFATILCALKYYCVDDENEIYLHFVHDVFSCGLLACSQQCNVIVSKDEHSSFGVSNCLKYGCKNVSQNPPELLKYSKIF